MLESAVSEGPCEKDSWNPNYLYRQQESQRPHQYLVEEAMLDSLQDFMSTGHSLRIDLLDYDILLLKCEMLSSMVPQDCSF